MLHATGQETGEVEVVKSWRHLQGPATCTEVGFYSKSNMYEKKSGLIHLLFRDRIKGRIGREAGEPLGVCCAGPGERIG